MTEKEVTEKMTAAAKQLRERANPEYRQLVDALNVYCGWCIEQLVKAPSDNIHGMQGGAQVALHITKLLEG